MVKHSQEVEGPAPVSATPAPESDEEPPWHRALFRYGLAVQGITLFLLTRGVFFYADDFLNFRLAQEQGFAPAALLEPLGQQVAPLHRLFNALLFTLAPLNSAAARLVLLAFLLAAVALMRALLARMYGDRPWTVFVALAFGFSIVQVDLLRWWAAGLHVLPATAATLVVILAYLRFRETGSASSIALSFAALAIALLFSIKAMFVPLYLLLLQVLLLDKGQTLQQLGRDLWHERRMWQAYLAIVAAAVMLNATLTTAQPSPDRLPAALDSVWLGWFYGLGPAALGVSVGKDVGALERAVLVAAAAQLVLGMLLGWTLARNPRAWRAWAVMVLAFLPNAMLIGMVRVTLFGPTVAYVPRYLEEALLLAAIALPTAFIQPAGHHLPAEPPPPSVTLPPAWKRPAVLAGIPIFVAYLAVSLATGNRLVLEHPGQQAGEWVSTNMASLEDLTGGQGPISVVNTTVPEEVLPPLVGTTSLSNVLPLYRPDATFDGAGRSPIVVGPDGTAARAEFFPHISIAGRELEQQPGIHLRAEEVEREPAATCLTSLVRQSEFEYRLPPEAGQTGFLHFTYDAVREGSLRLFVDGGLGYPGEPNQTASIRRGRGELLLPLDTPTAQRILLIMPRGEGLCVRSLEIGAVPEAG